MECVIEIKISNPSPIFSKWQWFFFYFQVFKQNKVSWKRKSWPTYLIHEPDIRSLEIFSTVPRGWITRWKLVILKEKKKKTKHSLLQYYVTFWTMWHIFWYFQRIVLAISYCLLQNLVSTTKLYFWVVKSCWIALCCSFGWTQITYN